MPPLRKTILLQGGMPRTWRITTPAWDTGTRTPVRGTHFFANLRAWDIHFFASLGHLRAWRAWDIHFFVPPLARARPSSNAHRRAPANQSTARVSDENPRVWRVRDIHFPHQPAGFKYPLLSAPTRRMRFRTRLSTPSRNELGQFGTRTFSRSASLGHPRFRITPPRWFAWV